VSSTTSSISNFIMMEEPSDKFPCRIFKHMKAEHAELLVEHGELMLGTYYMYKTISNPAIVDEQEGYKWAQDKPPMGEKVGKDHLGNVLSPDDPRYNLIEFGQMTMHQQILYPDTYIFCTTRLQQQGLFPGYDACVEITDEKFILWIRQELLRQKLISNPEVTACGILYVKDKILPRAHKLQAYWIKDVKYKHEEEYRIVFFPPVNNPKHIVEPVKLVIPSLRKYCKRVW
jgi:hypothetical protein